MNDYDFTKGDLKNQILKIALPASIGMFFQTMFNFVDTYFAGSINSDALAGLTLSFPIFFIIISISNGMSTGLTALLSNSLGKKDHKYFEILSYNGFVLSFLLSIFTTIIGLILSPALFNLFSPTESALTYGLRYTNTIFLGSVFFFSTASINSLLNSVGKTKYYRNFLILGFILNCILDPIFIYGFWFFPQLDTLGVALATILIQLIGSLYLLYKLITLNIINFKLFGFSKLSLKTILSILKQGLPASFNMMTIALGSFVINYFITHYGSMTAVAGYGAALRIEQIGLLPTFGFNVAALSIAGQNNGAKNFIRIKQLYHECLKYGVSLMLFATILIYPFADFWIGLINSSPDVISYGSTYLKIEAIAFTSYVFLSVSVSILQGLKLPFYALYIGLYRQLIMPIIVFYILGTRFNMGLNGIWWGIVLINWSAVFITLIYTRIKVNFHIEKYQS